MLFRSQACKALRQEGYRIILVNSNPATIMTDPEFADRTYIEPITPECVEKIIAREIGEMERLGAQGKLVLLPTLGGQTALNTAMALYRRGTLKKHGVEMIGANARAIERGEDARDLLRPDASVRVPGDAASPSRRHPRARSRAGPRPRRRSRSSARKSSTKRANMSRPMRTTGSSG